jgi:hypothetical protein
MKRNSTTIFIEVPGSVIPVPWISNAPDFTGFTDPTLSVLQSTWASYTGPIEVISDPLSGWDGGSAETQLPSISLNGVTIFAAPNPSLYPTERPNGQPLIAGDIVWDALAQDWVRWDGSEWNSEIKAIVKSDGLGGYIINYDFRTATEPTIRPDGLAIQEGDRWEKPGEAVYYRSGTNWLSSNLTSLDASGRLSSTTAFIQYATFPSYTYALYIAPGGSTYWLLTATDLQYSLDFGVSWVSLGAHDIATLTTGTITSFSLYVANDESFFIASVTTLESLLQVNVYSLDGVTWALLPGDTYSGDFKASRTVAWEDIDGTLYVSVVQRILYSSTGPANLVNYLLEPYDQNFRFYQLPQHGRKVAVLPSGTWCFIDLNTRSLYTSTDKGVTWNLAIVGTYNEVFTDGTTSRLYITDEYFTYYTDDLSTVVTTGLLRACAIDSQGAFVQRNTKSPSAISSIVTTAKELIGSYSIRDILIEYYVEPGQALNHDASNRFSITLKYTNLLTQVATTYIVVLDTPYPSDTPAKITIPVDEAAFGGASIQVVGTTTVGTPSPILVSVLLTANKFS